jgi:hypothetical protein
MAEAIVGAIEPRSVDGGRGASWWSEGWALFMKNPLMWFVFGLLLIVIYIVLMFVPLIGSLAGAVLMPVFIGGWMIAARKLEAGGTLEASDLFAGFQQKMSSLLVLGAIVLGAGIVVGVIATVLGFGAFMGVMMGGPHVSSGGMMAAFGVGMAASLLLFILGFVVAMALWFAPALVVFRNVEPLEALKASVSGSLKNIVPFLIYGLIYFVLAIVASIPIGLGWFVLVPVVLLSNYVSYKDVFGD